ncbi:MAG: DUF3891 family protein [Planctomycetaceae bacterium]|jgi:hypothetical protein|nr:DUF3891 family protein [Planctomycetaceae bacterium]MBT6154605.1 DUF3891 family protein [Planctomycetaceae bacterium]MBT6487215.1 DUF3891 family protein [Planctomycetaceae bacterium]MBT6495161.1 DUF3891 family protein [Planctomycetaceae bacterium]
MIRRDDGNDWLLFSQVDHAHLAAELAEVWGNDTVPAIPLPHLLIPAIRDHDEGWREWERSPELNPDSGDPRDFTEMPMSVATKLWTESVTAATRGTPALAEAFKRYQDFLAERNEALDGHRAAVLEILIEFRASFRRDEMQRRAMQAELLQDPFDSYFDELIQAGIVRHVGQDFVGDYYVLDLPHLGTSPLGGIWVSRHFCYLAEKARESRSDNIDDVAAIEQFLEEQAELQREWTDDSVRDFAGDELQRLIETGFRYVQFFDRISLWLCCAERTEAVDMKLPGGDSFQLIPRKDGSIAIEPYPLNVAALELTVDTRRMSARQYDCDDLQQAIGSATVEQLRWTLCR